MKYVFQETTVLHAAVSPVFSCTVSFIHFNQRSDRIKAFRSAWLLLPAGGLDIQTLILLQKRIQLLLVRTR